MLSKMHSIAITGIDAVPVEVEMDVRRGLPSEKVVGLPDKAVQEALERVKSALVNSGYEIPRGKLVFSLAPAELRKVGAVYDLPLALVALMSGEQLTSDIAQRYLVMGELSLAGGLRPVRGALAAAITAREMGMEGIVLPAANVDEAAAVEDLRVVGVETLAEAVGFFAGEWVPRALPAPGDPGAADPAGSRSSEPALCYSDMRGQEAMKRAMLVAAAGGHHCLLMGPPGSGKTMAAQRLPGILPPLSRAESMETTKIHSIAGELPPGRGLMRQRPFRAPHHNASMSGLVGGGSIPRPGELSLAHNGVLFLDEAPEFPRALLETLRQPLEDGVVTISRASGSGTFPARVQLVLSMNLCPCGRQGDPRRVCRCTPRQIAAYTGRISGPLADRIDLHVHVPPVDHENLLSLRRGEDSATLADQVALARERQAHRFAGRVQRVNGAMTPQDLESHCRLTREAQALLREAVLHYGLSARGHGRVLKVARTIADLADEADVQLMHLAEAVYYRSDIKN